MPHSSSVTSSGNYRRQGVVTALALVALTFLVYWPVAGSSFVNYDDDVYVTGNPMVLKGLTQAGVRWAFESLGYASNWHPLTWLSHMVDVQLFGLNACWHHLVNVLLHAASTVVLFVVLRLATSWHWPSALIAALFAVHPLHVESVAWVAERKDVLSGALWMVSMLAYVRYARSPSLRRYAGVIVAFALGLLAKPMVVTFPFAMMLMDYWPLARINRQARIQPGPPDPTWAPLFPYLDKLPLLLLSAGSGTLTYLAQKSGGAMSFQHAQHLDLRLSNALLAYVHHLGKTFWPTGLTVYYPYRSGWGPTWKWVAAGLVLAAITMLAARASRFRPCLLVGWLWFLGTLVPVIGIVQVGSQAVADRYVYLPHIGLFFAMGFGVPWGLFRAWGRRIALPAAAVVALVALVAISSVQVRYWRNSGTLFAHAVEINPTDIKARDNYGVFLKDAGRLGEALEQFGMSLRTSSFDYVAWFNAGIILCQQGRAPEAKRCFDKALGINPALSRNYLLLGKPCAE